MLFNRDHLLKLLYAKIYKNSFSVFFFLGGGSKGADKLSGRETPNPYSFPVATKEPRIQFENSFPSKFNKFYCEKI
jgi:hypothetical protein